MISLHHIITKVQRFVDGVCALQDVTKLTDAINGWTTQREEVVRGSFLRLLKDLGYGHTEMLRWLNDQAIESDYLPPKWLSRVGALEQQLAAEREAHTETRRFWGPDTVAQLKLELSAARADLEALTVWRLQSEEPCPDFGTLIYVQVTDNTEDNFPVGVTSGEARIYTYWRHTPESLAAWKAREWAGDGK